MIMDTLEISPTRTTPSVSFDAAEYRLEFAGQSYPENSFDFYAPIKVWLEDFLQSQPPSLQVDFKLDYFNTSSSKCLLDVLDRLEKHHEVHQNISIRWFFDRDDEDMEESGQDFGEDLNLPFELIPYDA